MTNILRGKSAIVTGAGSGINLEFARLLLHNGASVLFADLSLRQEAEDLINRYSSFRCGAGDDAGPLAVFCRTDVASWSDLESMFATAVQSFGNIDIICPGAGVFEPNWSGFWFPPGTPECSDDLESGRYKTLDINLTHPIRLTQMAIGHFVNTKSSTSDTGPSHNTAMEACSGRKSIINTSSVAAQIASICFPLYVASKSGLQSFVRCLGALEASHGIRVTAVCPGLVKTPLWLEDAEKLRMVKEDIDVGSDNVADNDDKNVEWVTPQKVAEVMLACVLDEQIESGVEGEESIQIRGGTCLEVLKDTVRDIPLFNNVGPFALARKGSKAPRHQVAEQATFDRLKTGWGSIL